MGSQVSSDNTDNIGNIDNIDNIDNTNYYQVWGYLSDDIEVPKHRKFADWMSFVDAEQMRKRAEGENAATFTDGMMRGDERVKIIKYYTRRRGDPTWLLYALGIGEDTDQSSTDQSSTDQSSKRLYGMYFDERTAQDKLEMLTNVLQGLNERNGTKFAPILETRDDREIREEKPIIKPQNTVIRVPPTQLFEIGNVRPVLIQSQRAVGIGFEIAPLTGDAIPSRIAQQYIRGLDEPSDESSDESSSEQVDVFHSQSGLINRLVISNRFPQVNSESSNDSNDLPGIGTHIDTHIDTLQEWFDRTGNRSEESGSESDSEDIDQLFTQWLQRRNGYNRHGSGRTL